ncbi:uncharacterized protein LOC129951591 isoform X2 [Eupeodes corollae]|uniref:uncharacterized protein LOC129951591 isoform X2 n=1 Tax=Eupeodes corollae TaxID=290404 RepID=UPI0024914AB2|nr:uncharacterized protein LOC129951591 isoform X2 [Eupeodes corollae]
MKRYSVVLFGVMVVGLVHGFPEPPAANQFGGGSQSSYAAPAPSGPSYSNGPAPQYGPPPQQPVIHKHVYVHVPPPEPEYPEARKPIVVPPPQKHYKIVFIKAPSPPAPRAPVIPQIQQNEEKTLVYVLVKKPDEQPDLVIPTPAPTQPSKPEVYFIRYKTQKEETGPYPNSISPPPSGEYGAPQQPALPPTPSTGYGAPH